MQVRVELRVSLNEKALYEAILTEQLVIFLIWVDGNAFDPHNEFIDLETKRLGDLESDMPHRLLVAHCDIFLDHIRSEDDHHLYLVEATI